MFFRIPTTALRLIAALALVSLAGCGLPRPGPNAEEIVVASKANGGNLNVVLVDGAIAGRARAGLGLGFSSNFMNLPEVRSDRINPGDTLSVTVWENVENGLLVGEGEKVANLQEIQVDQRGNIFVPYAGSIRAAGNTPAEIRRIITDQLGRATPDPQVEVRRVAGDGATVNVIGAVGSQGVYPVTPSTGTLTSMLAQAGGVTGTADITIVTVRRHGRSGSIFLADLYDNPANDIAMRADDTVIVEEDRRAFTALGATSTQARVPFPEGDLDAVEALAAVGGLSASFSDPTGIFVFRREERSVANRVTGRDDMAEGEPFVYVIDLTSPGGMFIAKDFQIRDQDTVYVTEAPFVAWARILEATSQTLNFASSLTRITDDLIQSTN
ncbi:MAG: polysaccharide biosynthesis/export family protein [Pseudomonadota bacterium]